jgi:inositol 1,4,5-triphosphate receptor type 1
MSEQLDKVISGANLVMRLLSAMCDGQHRAMQNTLRYQKQCKTRYNIVCDVASLMQFLVEVPVLSNIPVINDAIQALIEMCAGNFDNQHIALNGQVIGSINIILKNPLESVEGIRMQCKAIELLEVLLEETDVKYSEIFEAISKDLQISCVTCFIRNAYKNSSIDSNKKIDNTCIVTRNIFRAYHILLNLASKVKASFGEFVGLDDWDNIQEEPWRYLKKNTYSIEVNYITKDDKEILTKVYFPFSHQREMTKEEQCKLQAEINRDGPEEKVKDLLEWTQSVWKNDKHKEFLRNYLLIQILLCKPFVRWVILTLLTIILNILVLVFFKVPQFSNCPYHDPGNNSTLIIIPKPYECWLSYEHILLYLFGFPHLMFSLWMAIEYFIVEKPNLIFLNQTKINYFKSKFPILEKFWDDQQVKNTLHQKSKCFDIHLFSLYPLVCIFFVLSSLLGLLTYGYFYCFCLVIIFSTINVIQQVIKAVSGKVWQLTFVALLMISVMFVYAVLSYAFMSTFFDTQSNLFCRTLWECFVTVMREGILDTFGNNIPVTTINQDSPNFDVYLWRAIIDLSFYVVINIIGLNIITAILVDRFSELRAKKDAAYNDQKSVCFICGIPNDTFEKEGVKGKGFRDHYKNDHNVYSYIYYVLYIKSKSTQDHNAIEKYVYDMVNKKSVKFYPLHKAKALGY